MGSDVKVIPVTSDAFVLAAPRGRSEAARSYKLELLGLNHIRDWREALKDYLASWADSVGALFPRAVELAPVAMSLAATAASAGHGFAPLEKSEAGNDAP
jgi:hypothetical protein